MNSADATLRIVADDRENAGGVVTALRLLPNLSIEVKRLAVGDFLLGEGIVVERKTLADFAASVIDGRLFRQTALIAAESRRGVLILEGSAVPANRLGVPREALQGALITVSVFYGLAVLRACDPTETARLLFYVGRQAGQLARGALPRPGYRPKGKRARQLFVLQGLPAIGPERAEKLIDHFGSLQRVATASAGDLASVEGIGDKTAKRIRWALEEFPSDYTT